MRAVDVLGPGGLVARRHPAYEHRPQQLKLAGAVESVMSTGGRLLAEAGTGTGKSFAYLVPAIASAAERGERVVIATHTIALQEQLLGKDVPFLQGILPAEFSVVLAKGRGNFLCLRRMHQARHGQKELFDARDAEAQLERIISWSGSHEHGGSRQELDFTPDFRIWSQVNAEAGNCLGRACKHYDRCFYQAGRRRLRNANVIVANHHFLFADMSLRRAGVNLLPDFDHLVLDEAHTVEDVAAEYLGLRVSRGMVHYALNQLHGERGRGLLNTISASDEALAAVDRARHEARLFFDVVGDWVRGDRGNHRMREPGLFPVELARRGDGWVCLLCTTGSLRGNTIVWWQVACTPHTVGFLSTPRTHWLRCSRSC